MRSIITLSIVLSSLAASSQRYVDTYDPKDKEVKSLLGKGNDLNGFGSMDLKVTEFMGENALVAGAHGGVLVNRRFMLGLAGYGIATQVTFDGMVGTDEKRLTMHGGYGGIVIGGMVGSKEVIHLVFPIFIGAGAVDISDKNFFPNRPSDAEFTIENSAFMVVEPAAQVEVNISKSFRVAAGMAYRHVFGSQLQNVSDADLSGTAVMLSLRFGRF